MSDAINPHAVQAFADQAFPGWTPLALRQRLRPRVCPLTALIERVPPNARVLDVACGGGLFLALLAHWGRAREGIGFDDSAAAIRCARAMTLRLGLATRLSFETARVQDDWPGGEFDVVAMIDVMHHVRPAIRDHCIAQAARRLRPGGLLLYKDMAREPMWRALANRAHDLVASAQWIVHEPPQRLLARAAAVGLTPIARARINQACYAHEVFLLQKGDAAHPL